MTPASLEVLLGAGDFSFLSEWSLILKNDFTQSALLISGTAPQNFKDNRSKIQLFLQQKELNFTTRG